MNNSWPSETPSLDGENCGIRPSGSDLLGLVDTQDPAFMQIAAVLCELRDAGTALDETTVREAVRLGRQRHAEPPAPVEAPREMPASIVYYIRRDEMVKIGVTRSPRGRFASLLPDEIIAFEPGTRIEEAARHEQFAHLRIGRSEYFEQAPELASHMQLMRQEHGNPDPTWPTVESLSQLRRGKGFEPPPAASSPDLVTALQGARAVGVKKSTVDGWVHRGRLTPVERTRYGRPLYFLDHVRFLAEQSFARGATRVPVSE